MPEIAAPYPLVSIVTPVFNAMPYIVETIESVRAQNYPVLEHILFDGGSTDGTLDVLKRYADLQWVSEQDRGQSDALNKAFRRAKGEIIGWLNADDTYEPGAVLTAVEFFQQNPKVDLIYGDAQIIDEASRLIGLSRGRSFSLSNLLFDNVIKQPTVFMRRRVVETLKGVNEDLHFVMDRELWLRAGTLFNLKYLPDQTFANFRLCPGTKSFEHNSSFRKEWLQVLQNASYDPKYHEIPLSIWKRAIQKNRALFSSALMMQAINERKRGKTVRHFIDAISQDVSLAFNRGMWLFLIQGMLGKSIDRYRRFKKPILD